MNYRELSLAYREKFEESAGIPWGGFPSREIGKEYLNALAECIEKGEPLTLEQRKYFFPLEYEDVHADMLY